MNAPQTLVEHLQTRRDRLMAVYVRLQRTRPHWPDTFEAAEADPIIGRLLKLYVDHDIMPRDGARLIASDPPEVPQGGAFSIPTQPLPPPIPENALTAPNNPLRGTVLTRPLSGKDLAAGERVDCHRCDGEGELADRYDEADPYGALYLCPMCNGTGFERAD